MCTDTRVIKSNYLIQMFFELFVFQSFLRMYQTLDLPLPISVFLISKPYNRPIQFESLKIGINANRNQLFILRGKCSITIKLLKQGQWTVHPKNLHFKHLLLTKTGVSSKCFLIHIKILEFPRRKEFHPVEIRYGHGSNVKKQIK